METTSFLYVHFRPTLTFYFQNLAFVLSVVPNPCSTLFVYYSYLLFPAFSYALKH